MTTRQKCPGAGAAPAFPLDTYPYPSCPVCGREFSAQGVKAQRRIANAHLVIPSHFERMPA